jgi:sterol carrier protein 2
MNNVIVGGVGMTPFVSPRLSRTYDRLAREAADEALSDAGLASGDLQQAYVGYVYGDSCSGQLALSEVAASGLPIINVTNNCATGSSALFLACQAIAHGAADCVLALGFEQMRPGAITELWDDRPSPLSPFTQRLETLAARDGAALAPFLFGAAGAEYQARYGVDATLFAQVAVKARRHAEHNPRAFLRQALSLDEVLSSPRIYGPLTRLQACPPTCGAAAAVLCSEPFARRRGVRGGAVIVGQAMATDRVKPSGADPLDLVGFDMTCMSASAAYNEAGIDPADLDVVELHDCFTTNEILSYEALGLAGPGGAEKFVRDGGGAYGGPVVVNPSGGLLAKGHPLGATGLAQCVELTEQLRGDCGPRQAPGARLALQHNIGLGGACVVTLYEAA